MTSPCHSQRKELSNQVGGRPLALHTHTVLVLASFMASLGKAITFWSLRLAPNRERPLGKPVVMLSERLRRYRFFAAARQIGKSTGFHPAITGCSAWKMDQSGGSISRSLPLDGDRGHDQWFEAADRGHFFVRRLVTSGPCGGKLELRRRLLIISKTLGNCPY